MKLNIHQEDLIRVINIAQKAISPRTTMQVLSGILFEAKNGFLKLSSTDFDISIKTKTNGQIIEEGSIVIGSSLFGNIVRKLPREMISMETNGNTISIKCGEIEYDLRGLDKSEYPNLPEVNEDPKTSLSGNALNRAIEHTLFSTSVDDSRAILTGVLIEHKDGFLNFVSLDGYRLSRIKYSHKSSDFKVVVPAKSLAELAKIVNDEDDVKISVVPGHMLFEFANTHYYTRLLEGAFVDYEAILGDQYTSYALMDRGLLIDALERISSLASDDKAKLIKLSFTNGKLEIRANTETGEGYEMVPIELHGEDLNIAFNSKYFLEGVKVIDSEMVKIYIKGQVQPCIIEPVDEEGVDYLYLVLPVKLKSEAF